MSKEVLRAFISYSVKDKVMAADVKGALLEYGIKSFLAHDDLHISEIWKERILEELKRCHIFVPLLSEAFCNSNWTDQETGLAFSRDDVVIIPVSVDGTMPYGFISHCQGKRVPSDGNWDSLLREALLKQFPRVLVPYLICGVEEASSFRNAEKIVGPLVDLFPKFTKGEASKFAKAVLENNQVWSANLCRTEYLPAFIKLHSKNVPDVTLKALKYQIKHNKVFRGN